MMMCESKLHVSLPPEPIYHSSAPSPPYQSRFRVEPRDIRSRLDFTEARLLMHQYGFPRKIVARALRNRFERDGDDFTCFNDFYTECESVAVGFGIEPPTFSDGFRLSFQGEAALSQVRDDGSIIGEQARVVTYEEEPERLAQRPARGLCWACRAEEATHVALSCGHLSLCPSCGPNASSCPQCRRKVVELVKVYKS